MPRVLITGATGFVGQWMKKTMPKDIEYIGIGRSAYEGGVMEMCVGLTHIVHLAPVYPDKVIQLAKEHNARLLYASSGIVYYPEHPSDYRMDKVIGETVCIHSEIDYVIARLFTFFGNMKQPDKAITQFFECARQGKPLQVWGECTRSYMHGAEMGRQMWKILFEGERGIAYDVGSKTPVSLLRLAKRIQAFTGCEIEQINKQVPVPYYVPEGYRGIMD